MRLHGRNTHGETVLDARYSDLGAPGVVGFGIHRASLFGTLYDAVAAEGIAMPMLHLGLPDAFQHHASREQLLSEAGLDAAGIRVALLKRWPDLAAQPPAVAAR